ncbi:CREB-binding protein-like isoform X1 [Stegodyphus dumicola]|uniref:CREB-binding protein-like isoform X1 n=1 Tax=Stegodyphus dumicola TaxID=202533 RepID=UPI0015AFEEAF|nr:CREB-binding protein-like isoform X1 [Stegodyphus dumicola]
MAHIWASPPSEGDDYIFNCHPPEQKIPKPGRLHEWYKILIDKGIKNGIIVDYKDIFMQALEDNLKSVSELPYFDGDYWPDVLEHSIKELANEERKAKASAVASSKLNIEQEDDMQPQKKKRKSDCSKMLNKSKCSHRKSNKFNVMFPSNDLSAKLYSTMEKFRKAFYVIHLHSAETAEKLPPVVDPDPSISCDLMDSRDVFLTFTRENNYEFSSLRRAKFSTMALLCELRTQGQDNSVFVCNKCHKYIEGRYHCPICDDFDLCVSCYGKEGHNHEMEKVGCGIDHDSAASDSKQANLVDSRNLFIQYGAHFMVHAYQCRDANCSMQQCRAMKLAIQHASSCVQRTSCNLCRKLHIFRIQHSKNCQETSCVIPGCSMVKLKLHLHRPLLSALNQA